MYFREIIIIASVHWERMEKTVNWTMTSVKPKEFVKMMERVKTFLEDLVVFVLQDLRVSLLLKKK